MTLVRACTSAVLLATALLPSIATAAWHQPVGGADPVNQNADKETGFPAVASVGGVPYVAWNEEDTELGVNNLEVRVAQLNTAGTAWTQPWSSVSDIYGGINRSATKTAFDVDLTAVGADPYVAWVEDDGTSREVRVARLNGSSWVEPWTGVSDTYGGINQSTAATNAEEPRIVSVGGAPDVAWTELDGTNLELRVSRLNGATWQQIVGGASPINTANNRNAQNPSLADVGGVPYVAWDEPPNVGSAEQVRVSRLNGAGTAWEQPWTGANAQTGAINHDENHDAERPEHHVGRRRPLRRLAGNGWHQGRTPHRPPQRQHLGGAVGGGQRQLRRDQPINKPERP